MMIPMLTIMMMKLVYASDIMGPESISSFTMWKPKMPLSNARHFFPSMGLLEPFPWALQLK